MKLNLLFGAVGIFTLFAYTLQAQITIDSTHIAQIGATYYEANDTIPDLLPGPAGANQTWNFTPVNAHNFNSFSMVDPATTPNGSSHPSSNIASEDANLNYVYYSHTANELKVVGIDFMESGFQINVPFNPNEKVLEFPSTYNTSFTDTMSFTFIDAAPPGSGADSIKVKSTKFKNVTADGWGNISTPEGTFSSIRFYEPALTIDSVWAKVFGMWSLISNTSDSSHTYTWWTNDASIGVPLLTVEYDNTLGQSTAITWYSSTLPCLNPDVQAASLTFSAITDSTMTLNWTNGNGNSRLVLARENVSVDATPENATNYTANSTFGTSGTELGNSYVVFNGSGNTVTVTGLTPGTAYHYAIFEYRCSPERYFSQVPLTGNDTTTNTVGINDFTADNQQISIYPNPVIQGQPVMLSMPTDVRVFNTIGKEVYSAKKINLLTTTSMSPGFYIILTENNQRIKVVVD